MTSRDPQRCCEAVRSAILATAWLLVAFHSIVLHLKSRAGKNRFEWIRIDSLDRIDLNRFGQANRIGNFRFGAI